MDKVFSIISAVSFIASLISSTEKAITGKGRGAEKKERVIGEGTAAIDELDEANILGAAEAADLRTYLPRLIDILVAFQNVGRYLAADEEETAI
jgi:hypothetical protein